MTMINTNTGALTAQANLAKASSQFDTAMTRLSSGLRINSAKDDAAGMAIAGKMTSQIMGMNQAVRNANDGKSLVDTTESAHAESFNMLQRLRELAVQSTNDTNSASNRGNIMAEANQMIAEMNSISENTTWNGLKVIDGSFTGKQLQIGADSGQTMTLDIDSTSARDIGVHTVNSAVSLNSGPSGDTGIVAGTTISIAGPEGSSDILTTAGQSAKDMADQVNSVSASTGVSASAVTMAKLSDMAAASTVTFEINDVAIGNVNISDVNDMRGLRDAINDVSGRTGVTATMGDTNGEVILTDRNGDDIGITNYDTGVNDTTLKMTALNADGTASGAVADTHTTTFTDTITPITASFVSGQIEMSSTKMFSVASTNVVAGDSFFEATDSYADLDTVAEIDLTTSEGAAAAIKVLDGALEKLTQSRSNLGAVSNRLDSTVNNLTNVTVNIESSRSAIMDADFSAESTNLARSQVLSQAATAMLAQANSTGKNVMSLLRG